ncbi:MAG: FecR domain-containing protein [Planctomycetia bacterium]|nr:FecR domain-containing protein [Planctomycetia bacterium]
MPPHQPDSDPATAGGDKRLHGLISGMTDGTLSDAELSEFSSRLTADPQARAVWYLRTDIEHCLARATAEASAGVTTPRLSADTSSAGGVRPRAASLPRGSLAAFALAGLVAVAFWLGTEGNRERSSLPLARVTDTQFVVVDEATAAPRLGDSLAPGTVRINAGVMQVTLRNGVVITLQGPASLDLIDEHKAFLASGGVVVKVPKGMSGFRLDTASTRVLDLGTEFAVRAGDGLVTDVQVYDGAVIASRSDGNGFPTRLEEGQAARFDPESQGDPQPIRFVSGRFIRNTAVSPAIEDHRFAEADKAVRMYGRPRHESLQVRPAPRTMTIDGRLDEWPAPGFVSSAPGRPRETHGVEGSMMYDAEWLYIAAHIADPAPLRNQYDPDLDPRIAWQGGGLQIRFSADRKMGWPVDANSPEYYRTRRLAPGEADRTKSRNPRLSHLTLWHHAASGKACIALNHGTQYSDPIVNPPVAEGAFVLDTDGRGYTLEWAIPWRLLNAADDPPQSGDVLGTVWQAFWADPSGRLWRDQMIEIRNLLEPVRMLPHERAACWGRAEFQ